MNDSIRFRQNGIFGIRTNTSLSHTHKHRDVRTKRLPIAVDILNVCLAECVNRDVHPDGREGGSKTGYLANEEAAGCFIIS